MTPTKCKRAWEAEAAEDGRLVGELRDAFLRHAATCRDCSHERAALDAIRGAVEELAQPIAPALHRRRLRAEVLRNANEVLMRQSSWYGGSRVRPAAFIFAGVLAIAMLAFALGRLPRNDAPRPVAALVEPARFDVANVQDADWRTEQDGSITRVVFRQGTVSIHVDPLKPGQRFLMSLPDGELEVHGTRFTVRVDERGTEDVEVTEGIVALRIQGQPERRLGRGDRWARAPLAPASGTVAATAAAASSGTQLPPDVPSSSSSFPPQSRSASSNAAPPSASGTSEFAVAMKAFSSGSYAEADDRLGTFIARHPADPRCEDAAFLRAVSRARMGDQDGAALRANAYLRSHPNGLRRSEAEAIARAR